MLPSEYSNKLGQEYSKQVTNTYKKDSGQFFTPIEIARFMSNLSKFDKQRISILDPGFGAGILTCALIEHLIEKENLQEIELVCYENDLNLKEISSNVLKYLKNWLRNKKINFKYVLNPNDFILANAIRFNNNENFFGKKGDQVFDIVICNPPYFKISGDDERARIAKDIVNGHPNIYSIFVYYSTLLLKPGGEYIFIIPRGFTSGYYFKNFRDNFFNIAKLEKIHLFESRRKTFDNEKILQESIIIKGIRSSNYPDTDIVEISSSNDYRDLNNPNFILYQLKDILNKDSKHKILHVPINKYNKRLLGLFKNWSGSLNKYNLQISTGPVVSFRSKNFLTIEKENENYTQLFDLFNVSEMNTIHPINKNKPQYIKVCNESLPILTKNKNYVFLRRFSTKEDKKRLVAGPYFMDITSKEFIGIENHLNYIYRPKGNMARNEVLGISAILNSTIFDEYFRIINGNINVSATELRNIPLPPLELIKLTGDRILLENNFTKTDIDLITSEVLGLRDYKKVI